MGSLRARTVLLAAQGLENEPLVSRLDFPLRIVSQWRKRFFDERLPGSGTTPTGRSPVSPERGGASQPVTRGLPGRTTKAPTPVISP